MGIDCPLPTKTEFILQLFVIDERLPVSEARCEVAPVSMYQFASVPSFSDMELKA